VERLSEGVEEVEDSREEVLRVSRSRTEFSRERICCCLVIAGGATLAGEASHDMWRRGGGEQEGVSE
jgi:hypothetical protein